MPVKDDNFISSNKLVVENPLRRATIKLPSEARILQSVTVKYKKLDGSIASQTIELQNSIDWHLPLFISQNYVDAKEKKKIKVLYEKRKIGKIKYATFYSLGRTFKVVTKDKLLRSFFIVDPNRIVLDFVRNSYVHSYKVKPKDSIFKEIRVGNHEGYYRVVVELDGYYKLHTQKIKDGYKVDLR
jgi:hypothetical protein